MSLDPLYISVHDKGSKSCKDNERQQHLDELISTEETYVYDLTLVVDVSNSNKVFYL